MHLVCIRCGYVKKAAGTFFARKRPAVCAVHSLHFHFSMVSFFCRRRIKNGVSVCIGYVTTEIGYAVLLRYLFGIREEASWVAFLGQHRIAM